MNFYLSICQLLQAAEGLNKNLDHLAERSFRISPRDSRANREILEQCAAKAGEIRKLLGGNAHLSKVDLRHASLLLQILQLSFFRMLHLASASLSPEAAGTDAGKVLHSLFLTACRHFGVLKDMLLDIAGIPLTLELQSQENEKKDGSGVFQQEESYQKDSIGLLDKVIECFDEEPELQGTLVAIRQDLMESRKKIRRFCMVPILPKTATPVPALSTNRA